MSRPRAALVGVPSPRASMLADLDSAAAAQRTLVGGKAVGLHQLRAAGLPCPPGIVVTTEAHQLFLQSGNAAVLAGLAQEAARLGGPAGYAVRSSAVVEDGATRSCAGLYLTRLGVPSADLESAVHACWASVWSSAALAYQASEKSTAMAVVVQPLVDAECSAVVFTADPTADARTSLNIRVESARGLGERLVSGRVTGDAHVVDRITLRTLSFQRGDEADAPVLNDATLKELVDLALRAERAFGHPLDVEAAFVGDQGWWLTQARPITSGLSGAAAR